MDFRVLGPLEAAADGNPVSLGGPKQRLVLALLLIADGRPVSVDALTDRVWGDSPPANAPGSIHSYVSRLRSGLGGRLERKAGGYVLQLRPEEVDAHRFERLVSEAQAVMASDPEETARLLHDGLAMWRGPPYADLGDDPALQAEVWRLEELRIAALEDRIAADLALGHHADLVAELEVLCGNHPFRERFQHLHMLALYRSGRQAESLQAYQRTKSLLREEFGIDPCQDLQDLEAQILEHDLRLDLTGRPAAAAIEVRLDAGATVAESGTLRVGESCTAAFLCTDVEDSTFLWDTDESSMGLALAGHDEIVAAAVEAFGGRVFKHTGDGMLSMFPDVDSAVAAAVQAIAGFAVAEWGRIGALPVRMAIDFGDALVRSHDLAGPVLNRANRLLALANSGQLLLSEIALGAMKDRHERRVVDLGERRLKGLAPMRVFELVVVDHPSGERGSSPHLLVNRPAFTDHIRGYHLLERVGEGSLATVYRAIRQPASREVAIKVIRPEVAGDPEFVRCFESDAKIVAQLEHPHVTPLHDYWREAERAFLVTQYVNGGSLRLALDRGAWHVEPALRLLEQVTGALEYAHRQGIMHRDVRPANVMLDDAGNAYLVDFGLAVCAASVVARLSSAAIEFMAPEVRRGAACTPTSDLCSLGNVARELLTGHRPDTPLHSDEDQHHDLPRGFVTILDRATAQDSGDRFGTPGEFLDALRVAVDREGWTPREGGLRYHSPMLC